MARSRNRGNEADPVAGTTSRRGRGRPGTTESWRRARGTGEPARPTRGLGSRCTAGAPDASTLASVTGSACPVDEGAAFAFCDVPAPLLHPQTRASRRGRMPTRSRPGVTGWAVSRTPVAWQPSRRSHDGPARLEPQLATERAGKAGTAHRACPAVERTDAAPAPSERGRDDGIAKGPWCCDGVQPCGRVTRRTRPAHPQSDELDHGVDGATRW